MDVYQDTNSPAFSKSANTVCTILANKFPNIGEIHYHKENKTNGVKQIEFSAESNQFEKKNQKWE